jgi:hypothetical protein
LVPVDEPRSSIGRMPPSGEPLAGERGTAPTFIPGLSLPSQTQDPIEDLAAEDSTEEDLAAEETANEDLAAEDLAAEETATENPGANFEEDRIRN